MEFVAATATTPATAPMTSTASVPQNFMFFILAISARLRSASYRKHLICGRADT
jgi:hypothetical protein